MRLHWKVQFLRELQKKAVSRGELSKNGGLGQLADLKRGIGKKRAVFLREVDTSMHTTRYNRKSRKQWYWKVFFVFTLTGTSFATTIYYFTDFFFWYVNYANMFYKLLIIFWKYQDIQTYLYWKVFSTNIYRKIFFNGLRLFVGQ